MKNNKRALLIVIIVLLFGINASAQTAREIAEKASNVIDFKSMEMVSILKIFDSKGRERVKRLVTASKKFNGVSKTIIKFTAPADVKGTTMLIYDNKNTDDDMWIYLPALRKTRRIVSSEKAKSFMGSEFTNADMRKPNLNDFKFNIIKEESFDGKPCWVLEYKCKNEDIEDENGFLRQVSWIEKGNYLCHRIEFFDFDNELVKVQLIKNYRSQSGGGYFAFYMEKENIKNGRKSIITIDKFQQSCSMPESAFSPNALGK